MKKKAQITRLVRLLGSGWEEWSFLPFPTKTGESAHPPGGSDSVLAVPARCVMVAPIWINAVDPAIVRTSIALELEVRGLLPKKRPSDAVVSHTLVKGERTLVIATIFPQALPSPVATQTFGRYEASPSLVELAADSVTLWKEGADMVAAFTRGKQIVYWATCDAGEQGNLSAWVEMLVLQLLGLEVLERAPARFFLGEGLDPSSEIFSNSFGPGSRVAVSGAALGPSLDYAKFEWKPEAAHHAERKSIATAKIRKGMKALAAAYLFLALLGGLYFGWLSFKEERLKTRVANLEKQAEGFAPLVQAWQTIGPSAEQQFFPVEILHFVVQGMPRDGLRLTTYDVSEGHVVIEGEAVSATLASQFFGVISKEPGLADFRWEMPPPVLLPSNAARFHITGGIQ